MNGICFCQAPFLWSFFHTLCLIAQAVNKIFSSNNAAFPKQAALIDFLSQSHFTSKSQHVGVISKQNIRNWGVAWLSKLQHYLRSTSRRRNTYWFVIMVGKQNQLCFSMKKSKSSVCQDEAEGVLYLPYSATVVSVSTTWTHTVPKKLEAKSFTEFFLVAFVRFNMVCMW